MFHNVIPFAYESSETSQRIGDVLLHQMLQRQLNNHRVLQRYWIKANKLIAAFTHKTLNTAGLLSFLKRT